MTPIREIKGSSPNPVPRSTVRQPTGFRWDTFRDIASIVCSRESTYRTALDITAFDIPLIFSDLFRSFKKTMESMVEGLSGTIFVVISPILTGVAGKFLSKFMLPEDMQKNALHYLKFSMPELRDYEKFKKAKARIREEETEDKDFIASLYQRAHDQKRAQKYKSEAKDIERFCDDFTPSKEKLEQIYKLKKATIIGESLIEGGWWGGFGLLLRAFRKHILKEERFTGTMGYASDEESSSLGESGDLSFFQKVVGTGAVFLSPVMNTILLNKVEDEKAVKKSKFLQLVKDQLDMTHGVYPKLGLLFTQTTIPKWIGVITTSQGWYERIERVLKLLTVIPSWWLGHRVTNGLLAKYADKELSTTNKTKPGIMVEKEYLEPVKENDSFMTKLAKWFPEPAKIHHIINQTKHDKKLQDKAEDLHAKCLYKGFALHSAIVWVINMAVNYITKLRVQSALGK